MIAICSVLLWGKVTESQFRIEWFVYAQTASYLLTGIVALLIVIRKASFRRLNWNWPFFMMIIKQSLPFAILVLLMTFYNRIDSVMLKGLLPKESGNLQAGIYAHAYRLLDALNNIAYLFSVLLLPLFARLIKTGERVDKLVKLSFTLLFVVSVIFSVTSYFFSFPLMDLMYEQHIEESAVVFGVLMGCFVAISTTYVFGTLLTANGNLKHLNYVAAGGMVLNITLNVILIPRYGALGSAWTSLITQAIMAIIQVFLASVFFRFTINYSFILRLFFFFAGVVAINWLATMLPFHWAKSALLVIAASVLWAGLLQLLNIRNLINIFSSTER
jgi:O-antigen/teichoic acid export membrane protein